MTDISNTINDENTACETYRKELKSSFWKIKIAYHFLSPDSHYLMNMVKSKQNGLNQLRNSFDNANYKINTSENLKLEAKLLKLTTKIEHERFLYYN